MELYEVGGCVRDEILGVKSKDIDFTVVLSPEEVGIDNPFVVMGNELQRRGFKIHTRKPEYLTIRAKFPRMNGHPALMGKNWAGLDADFVLARRDGTYSDGRRPDRVEPGTLLDDLKRRDFTMNAIAKDSNGNLIDPFFGMADINHEIIRAVGNPFDRIREDKLRLLRAIRFAITKGFMIESELHEAIVFFAPDIEDMAADRVRDELEKMFKHDWIRSVDMLNYYYLMNPINNLGIRLFPTMKGK